MTMSGSPSGSPQGAKRLREDSDSFANLVEWVRAAGGMVHPAVTMVKSSRELQVVERIEQGTTVLQIPSKCLVTEGTVRSKNPFQMDSVREHADQLYHSPQDIELALFLAGQNVGDFFCAYLDSLPESSSFDALPRRWSSQQLELITGSPLLRRVEKAREGLLRDYQFAKASWKEKHGDSDDANFPSLQAFDDRMAAVSSRAFEGMQGFDGFGGKEGDTTMIPLLDLCNHHRGHNVRKNLSYSYEQGAIVVRAAQTVNVGDVLRITYGAQGNAQLLLNYGFCISNNIEPDGSSNDVLEFYPSTSTTDKDQQVVHLRAGPKSYSYGGLVKALDRFCVTTENQELGDGVEDEGPDDMEAFLDGCEEDEEEDWGDDDGGEDDEGAESSNADGVKAELQALDEFRTALEAAREAYTFKEVDLDQAAAATEWSPRHYAAILVQSESRTIHFFLRAIECIEKKLQKIKNASSSGGISTKPEDDALIQGQVEELSEAYAQIRHSGMF
jgi:hypothetical protein